MADNSEKYFLKWINYKLRPRNVTIESVTNDFADGLKLVALLEEVGGVKNTTRLVDPKNEIFKLQNLNVAMTMATKMVKNLGVNGRNFIQGTPLDTKLILGFIFDLVLHYQVDDIDQDGVKGKEGLLKWAQKATADHQFVNVTNFTGTWQDGMAFLALAHAYNASCCNYQYEVEAFEAEKSESKQTQVEKAKERLEKAFKLIQNELGVEQILDADFAVSASDKANITYLSLIFKAFSQVKTQNKSQVVIQNLIQKARQYEELKMALMQKIQEFDSTVDQSKVKIEEHDNIEEIQKLIQQIQQNDRESSNKLQLLQGQIENKIFNLKQHKQMMGGNKISVPEGYSSEELKQKSEAVHNANNEAINTLTQKIAEINDKSIQEFESKINVLSEQILKIIDEAEQALNQLDLTGEEQALRTQIQSIFQIDKSTNEKISSLIQEVESEQLSYNQVLVSVNKEKKNFTKDLIQKSEDSHKKCEEKIAQIKDMINNIKDKHCTELTAQISALSQEFRQKLEQIQAQITSTQIAGDQQQLLQIINNLVDQDSAVSSELHAVLGQLDSLILSLKHYGQNSDVNLSALTQELQQVHIQTQQKVEEIRLLIDKLQEEKTTTKKEKLRQTFTEFCKTNPNQITRQEFEQALIACEQAVDENLVDSLFANDRQPSFEDFFELMDALENDKETDEQCVLAFGQLGGRYITERELRDAKISEQDIQWLISQMPLVKEDGTSETPVSEEKKMNIRNILGGQTIKNDAVRSLEKMNHFVKQLASQSKKAEIPGEKKYDYLKFVVNMYE
ncbi:Calponin_homology (CH) domain-containing protein [Hexamita inflata]|uniref:Calponin homology (CH) domain-containing protein n=1 Tax=Hexamita inflata TaxID=28002 RepID=A0AA86UCF8_9EUKA|nr:Calponin homology (CH) domain-containing protein [Hexamita inflata]